MSQWLNNKKIISENVIKPCQLCGFCPYGQLVEEFPLRPKRKKTLQKKIGCKIFGHDCPVFYHAEFFAEDEEPTEEDLNKMVDEFGKQHLKFQESFKKQKDEM